jgi:Insertion element 4 transposase N-terminal/Transposase DDE domain
MISLVQEAAALSRAVRLSGLKRIVSRDTVKRALSEGGGGRTACKRVADEFMLWFVLAMALFCRDCYRQVYRWMRPWCKKSRVPGRSTLCEARQRLGVKPLVRLAGRVVIPLAVRATGQVPETPGAFYGGMRLWAMDGFVVDLPDTPENERVFGRPGGRAPGAFPQARVVALCEAGTRVMFKWLVKPMTTAEQPMADCLLKRWLAELTGPALGPALLLWDRNFFSYQRVKLVAASKTHLLARVKSGLILNPIRYLSDGSYLAKVYPSSHARKHDRDGVVVRVIDYTFDDPGRPGTGLKHRLVTTLLDEKAYPAKELVELYHVRWEQELAIGDVKTRQMERPTLRSQTPAGVVQELYALMIGHFVVRSLMAEAAAARPKPVAPAAVSFTAALKILRCRLPECPVDPRNSAGQRSWYQRLIEEIADEPLEPRRRNRINPRVIKRKMSNWKKKRAEHRNYPQPTKDFAKSIVMTC